MECEVASSLFDVNRSGEALDVAMGFQTEGLKVDVLRNVDAKCDLDDKGLPVKERALRSDLELGPKKPR